MSLLDAPELAPYTGEPKQMPSGAPGKHGVLDMSFARRGDRSVLAHLYREAPLLAQQALYWDEHLPGLPCVYLISTSGCVLQGDRLDVSVTVGAGAMAHVTTQAATKVHQMDANFAAQWQRLTLAEDSYLEFLPGPVIPHRHSRFITHTQATVAESATLLNAELLQPGRKYHGAGELFEFDLYSSTLTADRPDGTPLFTEKLIAEPWRHPVRQAGVMGTFDVFANVTLITPRRHADRIFEQVVPGADASTDCVAGASRLPNDAGLVYKVLGMETEPVKAKVRTFWELARRQVLGAPIPPARPWGSPLLPAAAVAMRSNDVISQVVPAGPYSDLTGDVQQRQAHHSKTASPGVRTCAASLFWYLCPICRSGVPDSSLTPLAGRRSSDLGFRRSVLALGPPAPFPGHVPGGGGGGGQVPDGQPGGGVAGLGYDAARGGAVR